MRLLAAGAASAAAGDQFAFLDQVGGVLVDQLPSLQALLAEGIHGTEASADSLLRSVIAHDQAAQLPRLRAMLLDLAEHVARLSKYAADDRSRRIGRAVAGLDLGERDRRRALCAHLLELISEILPPFPDYNFASRAKSAWSDLPALLSPAGQQALANHLQGLREGNAWKDLLNIAAYVNVELASLVDVPTVASRNEVADRVIGDAEHPRRIGGPEDDIGLRTIG
jgi:hypothetical protein